MKNYLMQDNISAEQVTDSVLGFLFLVLFIVAVGVVCIVLKETQVV